MTVRSTSLEAYRAIRDSGKLATAQWEVYEFMYDNGPLTAAEAVEKMRASGIIRKVWFGQTRARFTELHDMGLLESVGERKCSVTGFTAMVMDVTALAYPRKLKKSDWKKLGEFRKFSELLEHEPTMEALKNRANDLKFATFRKDGKRRWKTLVRESM